MGWARGAVNRRRGHPIPIAPDGARRGYIRALRRRTDSARGWNRRQCRRTNSTRRYRGHTLSLGLRSGNRRPGSRVIDSILRPPKSRTALYVLLPLNQTSTGHVTIAVFASVIFAFFIARIA